MGFLSFLGLGSAAGDAVAKPVEAVGGVLDALFTSDEERMTRQEALVRLQQKPALAQMAINATEAQHRNVFVAGWRPFIGWVCGLSLLYNYILRDLLVWVMANPWVDTTGWSPPPALQMEHLMTVLGGLLGLGVLRTVEKTKGVTR